jgi:hypothetical protein
MTKFKSVPRAYVLQDEKGVWAEFVDHEFETTDKKVIARLAEVNDVSQVEEVVEPKTKPKATKAPKTPKAEEPEVTPVDGPQVPVVDATPEV